jgi:hypothetical protein
VASLRRELPQFESWPRYFDATLRALFKAQSSYVDCFQPPCIFVCNHPEPAFRVIRISFVVRTIMPGKQAKILSHQHVEDLLLFADTTRHPQRNRVIILLSLKAGLRAAEIANLT